MTEAQRHLDNAISELELVAGVVRNVTYDYLLLIGQHHLVLHPLQTSKECQPGSYRAPYILLGDKDKRD